MTQINPNININFKYAKQNPNFKSAEAAQIPAEEPQYYYEQPVENSYEQEVQIPDLYYMPEGNNSPKTLKDKVKQVDVMGVVYPWLEHPLLMAGTSAGLVYGLDKLTNAWSGEYEQSVLGKAAKFGDDIANSKVLQSPTGKKVTGALSNAASETKKFLMKSDIIRAMVETPVQPEWSMPKSEIISQAQRIVHDDFLQIVSTLGLDSDKKISLKELHLTPQERTLITGLPEDKAVNEIILKRLGRPDAEITRLKNLGASGLDEVKDEILKEMGLTRDKIKEIGADQSGKYVDDVLEMARKSKGKIWIGQGEIAGAGKFQPLRRKIGMDSVFNRLVSISKTAIEKPKTALGRFFPKLIQKIHRGFTFGGGKLGMIAFIAPHLVHTMVSTKKAEPEDKVGTAVQGAIRSISWVFTIPLATQLIYALGGAKYAGMGKDNVKAYRELVEKYNNGQYHGTRKQLNKRLKALSRVKNQSLGTQWARKIAGFFTSDLGMIKPAAGENFFAKIFRSAGNSLKNIGNVPLRFIAIMGTMIGLDALIDKGIKAVFGRAYDASEAEMHEEGKKKQEEFTKKDLQARLLEAQKQKLGIVDPAQAEAPTAIPQTNQAEEAEPKAEATENIETPIVENTKRPEENAVEELQPAEEKEEKYIPEQTNVVKTPQTVKRENYTYIPSQDSVFVDKNQKVDYTKYIPSQKGANITKSFDNSGIEAALRRADRAEARALETLAGKFNHML